MRHFLLLALVCGGCPSTGPSVDAGVDGGEPLGSFCDPPPSSPENVTSCQPLATDYTPRIAASSTDTWPDCISDDGVYSPVSSTPAKAVELVAAFERISLALETAAEPTPETFAAAAAVWSADGGISARVQSMEDVHFDAGVVSCDQSADLDRCAGRARLVPLLNDAFTRGQASDKPRTQAARIEASLLWFFYLSTLSNVVACTDDALACDESWASYGGGTPRDAPLGLGARVRALGPETHERSHDGVLAVRCWRNLDHPRGIATDLARRDLAFAQLDRALLRGIALIIRQVLTELGCSTGDVRDARVAFLNTIAPWIDRAARERDPVKADVLKLELRRPWAWELNVPAAVAALDALFDCP